jgi:polyamine oxidase
MDIFIFILVFPVLNLILNMNQLWKRLAISDFSMTIYTKIFLKFPYKFWPSGPGTEFFLYTHVRRGYYPLWQLITNMYI